MRGRDETDAARVTPGVLGLVVALASAAGAAIATPNEARVAVVMFVTFNSVFAALGFAVGSSLLTFWRDRSGGKRLR